MPGRHGEHTVLPFFSGSRPAGHSSHDDWLGRSWAQPAGQSRQVSSSVSCVPALQAEHDALLRSYEELAGRGWRPEESLGGVVNSEGVVTEVVLRRRSPDNAV